MKKYLTLWLCLCLFCSLSVPAAAADSPDYYTEYIRIHGAPPSATDFATNEEYGEAYNTWLTDFERFVNWRTAERARIAEEEASAPIPADPIESAGVKNETDSSVSLPSGPADERPARARVDLAGNVYSLDGRLLSPGTALAEGPDEDDALLPDQLADAPAPAPASDADALAVIAGLVSDIASDTPVLYVDDLRPRDPPVEVLDGMKALVTSIFGEYTPVMTTSVITQTVGNDTHQYLLETVAPGAAGVDYEWLASVFLFGILLFCLMKLVGGVLK